MHNPNTRRSEHDDEHAVTALDELLLAVDEAEASVMDDREHLGKDWEAADPLTRNEGAGKGPPRVGLEQLSLLFARASLCVPHRPAQRRSRDSVVED